MKSILLAAVAVMPLFLFAQYTYNQLQVNFLGSEADAKKFTYQNLRLYPVHQKENFKKQFSDMGKYVSLKDAMDKKKVRITEKGNGASVNELTIENLSADTIIVITGQIVKGGQQDRIINKDFLLKPKSGKVNLPVFCVESGRWSYRSTSPSADFKAEPNVGTMSLRKVVEKEKDQSKVWSKVDELNSKNKTTTATKTYTAISSSADFEKKLKGYLDFFASKFANDPDIIGVIIVSGDKVLGCDMFANPQLFKQDYPGLLHAYATEAIINGSLVTVAPATVKSYTDKLLSSEKSQDKILQEKGNKFVENGKKIKVTSFD